MIEAWQETVIVACNKYNIAIVVRKIFQWTISFWQRMDDKLLWDKETEEEG